MKTVKLGWFHFERIEPNITQKKTQTYKEQCSVKRQESLAALQQETQNMVKSLFTFNKSASVSHPETPQTYFQAKLTIFTNITCFFFLILYNI